MNRQKHINDYRDGHNFKRFLESKVGQPWDKVYSEICAFADPRTEVGHEIRSSIKWTIETNVILVNGKPFITSRYGYGGLTAVRDMWVHPETGILMAVPKKDNSRWKSPRFDETEVDFIFINDNEVYKKIKGCWFHIKKETKPDVFSPYWGTFTIDSFTKRQLSHKEIEDKVAPLYSKGTNQEYQKRIRNKNYYQWESDYNHVINNYERK